MRCPSFSMIALESTLTENTAFFQLEPTTFAFLSAKAYCAIEKWPIKYLPGDI